MTDRPDDKPAQRRIAVDARATPDAGPGTFSAYASVFGVEYDIGWGFKETILPGAFTDSIKAHGGTIPIMWEHAWNLGPVGDAKVSEDDHGVKLDGQLYLDDGGDLVRRIYRSMTGNAVNEWSVAFWPTDIVWDDDNPDLDQIAGGDLAEASVCVRGANPETETLDIRRPVSIPADARNAEILRVRHEHARQLVRRRRRAAAQTRAAIAPHSTCTTDSSWDGGAAEKALDNDDGASVYRKEYAWQNPDGDPDSKSSYSFPHHEVSGSGTPGCANTTACSAGIAALNGGRGGHNLSDTDRQGVYNHLAKHLRDAGQDDIPELKSNTVPPVGRAYQPQAYTKHADELVTCPSCGLANDSDARYCDQCGNDLLLVGWRPATYHVDPDETVTCPTCGLMNDLDASFCDQCGTAFVAPDTGGTPQADHAHPTARAGHSHLHSHDGGKTAHTHDHSHNPGEYDHTFGDDAAHAHGHPDEPNADTRARLLAMLANRSTREFAVRALTATTDSA